MAIKLSQMIRDGFKADYQPQQSRLGPLNIPNWKTPPTWHHRRYTYICSSSRCSIMPTRTSQFAKYKVHSVNVTSDKCTSCKCFGALPYSSFNCGHWAYVRLETVESGLPSFSLSLSQAGPSASLTHRGIVHPFKKSFSDYAFTPESVLSPWFKKLKGKTCFGLKYYQSIRISQKQQKSV